MSVPPDNRDDEMRTAFTEAQQGCPALVILYETTIAEIVAVGINGRPIVGPISPQLAIDIIRATSAVGERGTNRFRANNNHGRFLADDLRKRRPDLARHFGKPRRRPSKSEAPTNLPPLGPADFEAVE